MGEKFKRFFRNSLGYIGVFIICAFFVASALLGIDQKGKTIQEIIFDAAKSFILGFLVTLCMKIQGLINGDNDPRMISTITLYGDTLDRVTPYIGRLDAWCEKKNAELLEKYRTRILSVAGLSYEECFDASGRVLPFEREKPPRRRKNRELRKIFHAQRRAYRKAVHLHLTRLSAVMLTGEGSCENDPNKEGRSRGRYLAATETKEFIVKVLYACVFGYFGITLITGASLAGVLWNGLQAAIFVALGTVKLYQAKRYVLDEYRQGIIRKSNYLQMFTNDMEGEHHGREHENHGGGAVSGTAAATERAEERGTAAAVCDSGAAEKIPAGYGKGERVRGTDGV